MGLVKTTNKKLRWVSKLLLLLYYTHNKKYIHYHKMQLASKPCRQND